MNEFTSKKLGEVLAFETVSSEIAKKAENALNKSFNDGFSQEMEENSQDKIEKIKTISEKSETWEAVETKANKTGDKLRSMQDLYLQEEDDWQDPAEIMEWLGFFEGAAIVHWALVRGSAESTNNNELLQVANDGMAYHQNFLRKIEGAIANHASKKSSA